MEQKLKSVMLVDDCEATNYYNKIVLESFGFAESIIIKQGAIPALDYLKNTANKEYCTPDWIFLDINMPGMNGWEFLEEYEKLDGQQRSHVVLIMITTPLMLEDQLRVKKLKIVNGFINKPFKEKELRVSKEKFS